MIIECVNCKKRFEIAEDLIPLGGRLIQCGSCNHTWFYKPNSYKDLPEANIKNTNLSYKITNEDKKNLNVEDEINQTSDEKLNKYEEKRTKIKNKNSFSFFLRNILSYFIVGIVSFVALIVILDTFNSPLSAIFPNLELLLYNLFESIEDIFLFLKNLLL